jgi:hypothetical protein
MTPTEIYPDNVSTTSRATRAPTQIGDMDDVTEATASAMYHAIIAGINALGRISLQDIMKSKMPLYTAEMAAKRYNMLPRTEVVDIERRMKVRDTCAACKKTWCDGHLSSSAHQSAVAEMAAVNSIVGINLVGQRRWDTEGMQQPLTKQNMRLFWGATLEALVDYARSIHKDGHPFNITVPKGTKGHTTVRVCASDVASYSLYVVSFQPGKCGKYDDQVVLNWAHVREDESVLTGDDTTTPDLPPTSSWWPVVKLEVKDNIYHLNENEVLISCLYQLLNVHDIRMWLAWEQPLSPLMEKPLPPPKDFGGVWGSPTD